MSTLRACREKSKVRAARRYLFRRRKPFIYLGVPSTAKPALGFIFARFNKGIDPSAVPPMCKQLPEGQALLATRARTDHVQTTAIRLTRALRDRPCTKSLHEALGFIEDNSWRDRL